MFGSSRAISFKEIEPITALSSSFDSGWRFKVVIGSAFLLFGIAGSLLGLVLGLLEEL